MVDAQREPFQETVGAWNSDCPYVCVLGILLIKGRHVPWPGSLKDFYIFIAAPSRRVL